MIPKSNTIDRCRRSTWPSQKSNQFGGDMRIDLNFKLKRQIGQNPSRVAPFLADNPCQSGEGKREGEGSASLRQDVFVVRRLA